MCPESSCGRPIYARGLCSGHYKRLLDGRPLSGKLRGKYASPDEAFEARTEWQGDCLIWTGSTTSAGYGNLNLGEGRWEYAHRFAWIRERGPIPEGFLVDHSIHCNPACCNVNHLRLASQSQNGMNRRGPDKRGRSGVRNVHWNSQKQRWHVRIGKNGKTHHFGSFKTVEEAAPVAEQARKDLLGEFAGKGE